MAVEGEGDAEGGEKGIGPEKKKAQIKAGKIREKGTREDFGTMSEKRDSRKSDHKYGKDDEDRQSEDEEEAEEVNESQEEIIIKQDKKKQDKQLAAEQVISMVFIHLTFTSLEGYIKSTNFSQKDLSAEFSLSLPANKPKIFLVSLIEEKAEKCIIQQVPGISKCALKKPTEKDPKVIVSVTACQFFVSI